MARLAPPFRDDADLIRRYVRGVSVSVADPLVRKAMFLREHQGWSSADYDSAEQDLIDLIDAMDLASARRAHEQRLQQQREAAAAAHRARIGV